MNFFQEAYKQYGNVMKTLGVHPLKKAFEKYVSDYTKYKEQEYNKLFSHDIVDKMPAKSKARPTRKPYVKKRVPGKSKAKASKSKSYKAPESVHASGVNHIMVFNSGKKEREIPKKMIMAIQKGLTPTYENAYNTTYRLQPAGFGQCVYRSWTIGGVGDLVNLASILPVTTVASTTNKYLLEHFEQGLEYQNMSNTILYMRVYEFVPRHDVPVAISVGTVLGSTGFGDIAGAGRITATDINGTLFDNPMFCAWFKIVKVRDIELSPGTGGNLKQQHSGARTVNLEIYNNSYYTAVKGITRGIVIQTWGGIVSDTVTNSLISTGKPSLDVVQTVKYTASQFPSNLRVTNTTQNLGAITVSQNINDLSGINQNEVDD